MSGAWPAFVMGVSAPATVRGVLSGIDASIRKPDATPPLPPLPRQPTAHEMEEREPTVPEGGWE